MSFLKKLFGHKTEKQNGTDNYNQLNNGLEEEFSKTMNMLDKFKRTAYLPIVVKREPKFSNNSKIGGLPFLRNENDWPTCPNCKKHMQFFIQLNLEELPERRGSGLAQLFYCTSFEPHCESDLTAFFPFSKAVECRVINSKGDPTIIDTKNIKLLDEKIITDWDPKDDYPHIEEYDILGIDPIYENEVYELLEKRDKGIPIDKDKLFGWPYWSQEVEYPLDRASGIQMELLFQFGMEDNLDYMFGDAGTGHLTQSPDNKSELAFGWAC